MLAPALGRGSVAPAGVQLRDDGAVYHVLFGLGLEPGTLEIQRRLLPAAGVEYLRLRHPTHPPSGS